MPTPYHRYIRNLVLENLKNKEEEIRGIEPANLFIAM